MRKYRTALKSFFISIDSHSQRYRQTDSVSL
jgi:hypothetical protein